ncbi:MAG: glycosyltransferase family 39 protein [Anaerolineales bacterium]|nr:glycosyltransferase family 39 protein [Anaerolineales bacterium]
MKHIPFPIRIFLLALLLRLLPVIALRQIGIGLDDMYQYDMLARSLASGNGYRWYAWEDLQAWTPYVTFDLTGVDYDPVRGVPTSFRAPLYPAFLALVYLLTGMGAGRFFAARLAQTLLSAALAPLTWSLARRLLPGDSPEAAQRRERAAVAAAWVVACYPLLIVYPFGLATENLFFPLVLLSLLFLLRAAERPAPVNFLLAGLFLGLAALTRSIILPFAGLAFLWLWFGKPVEPPSQAVKPSLSPKVGAFLAFWIFLMLVLPWVIRNSLLHDRLLGIETSLGYNLYLGYHPKGDGSFVFGPSFDLIPILDDAERDRLGMERAIEFIRAAPERFFPLALNRLGFFFGLEKRVLVYFYANNFLGYIPPLPLLLITLVMFLPFVIVAASAPLGLALLRLGSKTTLVWLLLGAYLLPHVLILSEDRFHLALVPLLTVLAAHAWAGGRSALRERWAGPRSGRVALALAALAILLLFLNWGWELWRDWDRLIQLFGPNGNTLYWPY